jgi:hypothetical protein
MLPNGDLVAGGAFTTAGGVSANRIARWNGSSWAPLGSGAAEVLALAVLPNGDLVAGGNFINAGGVSASRIARWNGSSWAPLAAGMNSVVHALTVLSNGDLVAGGDFTTAGGVAANRIARWDGSSWAALGSGLAGSLGVGPRVGAVAALPNGELVAGGRFSTAGGVPSNYFARWTETGTPSVAQQPAAQSIDAGATLTLSAACASGYDFNGAVSFQWQRNGVDIADGPGGASKRGGTVSGASGALTATALSTTLTITGARPSDAGEYTVVFTNSCGDATSVAATVTIDSPCAADLTGDGLVDSADLGALLSAWGTKGSSADITGDGLVDSADLGALLSAWGACE